MAATLFFYHLGWEPFQDYDEATYAEVSAESMSNHTYATFTFLDNNYFNKPPLLFWLIDASNEVIHDQEFADRFTSALASLLTVIAVGLVIYESTQSLYAAALGGGILATISAFVEPSRQIRFDTLVSLFIILSAFAFLRAIRGAPKDRKWFLWLGVFIGLAILSKGPLVIYALASFVGIVCVYKRVNWVKDGYFWGGVGIAIAIVLPWHIYESILFGSTFWDTYLFGQVVQRVQQNLFTIGPTNWEYIKYLYQFALPWIIVFPVSIAYVALTWKKISTPIRAAFAAAFFGIVSVLLVCFVTKTKAFSYLIPVYPFIAIFCGTVFYDFSRKISRIGHYALGLVCLIFLLLGLLSSIQNGFHINTYYSAEVSLAEQEKGIGEFLKNDHVKNLYVYNVTTLGSIMFYSRILMPIGFINEIKIPSGVYIIYPTNELSQLQSTDPKRMIVVEYRGANISLGFLQ